VRKDVAYRALEGRLEPGEKLVFLTDGLPEAVTSAGDPIGYPALETLMLTGDSTSPSDYVDGLFGRLRDATVPAIEDDWTALVLERPRAGGSDLNL
jgi:serine phosphatase RsbU (regulator of sigma subunit)